MIFYDTRIGGARISICECNGDNNLYYVTEMGKDYRVTVPCEGTRKACIEYVIDRLTQHYNSELAKFVDSIIERSN